MWGTVSDLVRMEKLILDKLSWELNAITPLTFLQLFYEVFATRDPRMNDQAILNSIVRKLEVIMCQFEFTQYRVRAKITYAKHITLTYLVFDYTGFSNERLVCME